jgi:hypothetical protein
MTLYAVRGGATVDFQTVTRPDASYQGTPSRGAALQRLHVGSCGWCSSRCPPGRRTGMTSAAMQQIGTNDERCENR